MNNVDYTGAFVRIHWVLSCSWISALGGRPRLLFPSGTTEDDPEVDATALLAVDKVPPRVEALSSEALRLRDSLEVDGAVAEEVVLSSATIVDLILLPSARMLRLIKSSASVEDLDLVELCNEVKSICQKTILGQDKLKNHLI